MELPQSGRISVDAVDLVELDLTSWRRSVAAIFQDFVRYELSVRDNIGFGAIEALREPDADQRVRAAIHKAGAENLVGAMPRGLDTPLSRRYSDGVDLSGGQRQRIYSRFLELTRG